jgi:cell division protease FtsH
MLNAQQQLDDHITSLSIAEKYIGTAVRAANLDWRFEQLVRKNSNFLEQVGYGTDYPLVQLTADPSTRRVNLGMEKFALETPSETLTLLRVVTPQTYDNTFCDFWAVPVDQFEALQKHLKRLDRKRLVAEPPVMRADDKESLWKNSIGFLTHGQEVLKKYKVARKRGVLLLGEPGNGKTTACKWLYNECRRQKLRWRSVNAQDFSQSYAQGQIGNLFRLPKPGVVLFDDFDQALWNRGDNGADFSLATFLTELDGVQPQEGVVYIFTSNARLADLDPAFRRPGRVDLVVEFNRPTADLRREYLQTRWHDDIKSAVDIDDAVKKTESFSYAEIEEIRKLMVLHFMDRQEWSWESAWTIYQANRPKVSSNSGIGFQMESTPVSAGTTVANA